MDSSNYPDEDIDSDNMSEEEEFEIDPGTETAKQRKRKTAPKKGEEGSKPRKKGGRQRSDVWQHFIKMKDDEKKCKCRHCGNKMGCSSTNGTSSLKKHLNSCKGYKIILESKDQTTISKEDDGSLTYGKVSEAVIREATNELLVLAELPLSFTEGVGWRHFCNKAKLYKPVSRRTASRDIVQLYLQRKEEMKRLVCQERVSLTTDIWLNEYTNASYMVITAHWIDSNWYLRKLIIGFKHVEDHTSNTIASTLLKCLADWGIKKVFTITVDNATANTSALKKFRQEFKTVGSDAMVLGGEMIHMRCAAHILNLVVKDGLKEVDESVSAIRNAVKYLKSGPNRQKSFNQRADSIKVSGGSVQLDMETRWNATYVMLTRALNHKLVFDQMVAEDKKYNEYFEEKVDGKKRAGPPTNDNWIAVDQFVRFLDMPILMPGTEFDILSWWRHNSPKYPILAKLAKDVLAMQVSSVASESAFSTSGRVLDPYRSSLTHYMIEILICTEQWLKSSLKLRELRRETTTQEMLSEITLLEDLEKEFGGGY